MDPLSAQLLRPEVIGAAASKVEKVVGIWRWIDDYRLRAESRRVLRLNGEAADVVLTQSTVEGVPAFESDADHELHVQLGYLRAMESLSMSLATLFPKKRLQLQLSDDPTRQLANDLILIGGTGGNVVARKFLERLNQEVGFAQVAFEESDATNNRLSLHGTTYSYNWQEVGRRRKDFHDYALVVFWKNPFSTRPRRAVFCAGFTPRGTHAALKHTLENILPHTVPKYRESLFHMIGRKLRGKRQPWTRLAAAIPFLPQWSHFAVVLEMHFAGAQPLSIVEREFLVLRDRTSQHR